VQGFEPVALVPQGTRGSAALLISGNKTKIKEIKKTENITNAIIFFLFK
jgi:hypothetical protein